MMMKLKAIDELNGATVQGRQWLTNLSQNQKVEKEEVLIITVVENAVVSGGGNSRGGENRGGGNRGRILIFFLSNIKKRCHKLTPLVSNNTTYRVATVPLVP
jgi:hypothetical protein